MSKRGWILFLSLGVLWGMPYLLIRIAVAEFDPLVVAGTRTLIGSLLLLPIALHRKELAPAFRKWKWLLAFTLVEITFPWVLLGHAETKLNSSTAGLLIAAVPLIAAVIITRLGHEKLEPRRLFGLGLGFAGVALLVGLDIDLSDFGDGRLEVADSGKIDRMVTFDKPGPYGWKQAVMLTISHPAHKTFFTRKLWGYFIPEPADDETQAELETLYVQSGYSTRAVLSAILKHPRLYEGPRMVKPPAVYLAGMLRILGDRISTEATILSVS